MAEASTLHGSYVRSALTVVKYNEAASGNTVPDIIKVNKNIP